MKKAKKLIAIALTLVMALVLLAACQPAGDGPAHTPGPGHTPGTGTGPGTGSGAGDQFGPDTHEPGAIGIRTLPWDLPEGTQFIDHIEILPTVSPATVLSILSPAAGGGTANAVYTMILDRLLQLDDDVETIIGSLAHTWHTDDAIHWTFYLEQGVYFHNGDYFTAQDVYDTIQLARAAPGSNAADYWRVVDVINIVDDYTIELTLFDPSPDFSFFLTMPQAGILNRRAVEEDPIEGLWVGTGAFTIDRFYSGMAIYMLRNDNWWGLRYRMVPTRSVVIRTVHEGSARTIMMMNGEAHFTNAPLEDDFPMFRDNPDFVYLTPLANTTFYLAFNMRDEITGDRNFRLAVAHALNRDDIAFLGTGGYGYAPDNGTLWGPLTPMRNNDLPLHHFDPDLARQYLAASNYDGRSISIAVSMPQPLQSVEVVAENLEAIGINVNINRTDSATLAAMHNPEVNTGHIVFHSASWMPPPSFISTMARSTGAINRASMADPYLDDLLDRAAIEPNVETRREMYLRIQELMWEDLPYLSMFYRYRLWVAPAGFGGVRVANVGLNYDYRFVFKVAS